MVSTSETMNGFMYTVIVMIFYSFAITGFTYVMPSDTLHYVDAFSSGIGEFEVNQVSSEMQTNLRSQTNIPLIDLGSLVFYSGNLFLDLIINFLTAIPQMITMLFAGIFSIIGIDPIIKNWLQLFLTGAYAVYIAISLIIFIVGQRSRTSVM